ncbi:hypothetical protein, partial [Pseudomonas syringae group genomosp. 7]|uniref:hypothetical protein n=1 Tax=Pseudomonas syringae group genomosp. 7 TaxID=251699 RepID=UPI00376F5907
TLPNPSSRLPTCAMKPIPAGPIRIPAIYTVGYAGIVVGRGEIGLIALVRILEVGWVGVGGCCVRGCCCFGGWGCSGCLGGGWGWGLVGWWGCRYCCSGTLLL